MIMFLEVAHMVDATQVMGWRGPGSCTVMGWGGGDDIIA